MPVHWLHEPPRCCRHLADSALPECCRPRQQQRFYSEHTATLPSLARPNAAAPADGRIQFVQSAGCSGSTARLGQCHLCEPATRCRPCNVRWVGFSDPSLGQPARQHLRSVRAIEGFQGFERSVQSHSRAGAGTAGQPGRFETLHDRPDHHVLEHLPESEQYSGFRRSAGAVQRLLRFISTGWGSVCLSMAEGDSAGYLDRYCWSNVHHSCDSVDAEN